MEKLTITDFVDEDSRLLLSKELEEDKLLFLFAISRYRIGNIKYVIERQSKNPKIKWTGTEIEKIEYESFDPEEAISVFNKIK